MKQIEAIVFANNHHLGDFLIFAFANYKKEWDMAIGILIKRVTKDGQDAKVLLPHIVELRSHGVKQQGYISGETFFNLDRKDECLVISRWTTLEHWQKWMQDPRRIELNVNMENQLVAKTE